MAKKKSKKIIYRQELCKLFASLTILVMGTASLLKSGSLDYYSVLGTLGKIVPATAFLGWLGYIIGSILDNPKNKDSVDYKAMIMDELMKMDRFNSPADINQMFVAKQQEEESESNVQNSEAN